LVVVVALDRTEDLTLYPVVLNKFNRDCPLPDCGCQTWLYHGAFFFFVSRPAFPGRLLSHEAGRFSALPSVFCPFRCSFVNPLRPPRSFLRSRVRPQKSLFSSYGSSLFCPSLKEPGVARAPPSAKLAFFFRSPTPLCC